jgi:tRNA (cytidine/uridine-2'-O-)-methyltransferase
MIHAVLYEPEIPQNTGNIIRTCAAFSVQLHLIEPLSFYLDETHLKRAGMDYRDIADIRIHPDWDAFLKECKGELYFTTRYGHLTPDSFVYPTDRDIYFVFGKESTGIPKPILEAHQDHCIRIPMDEKARCLNVSNTAAIILYEALRQRNFAGLSFTDKLKDGVLLY